jgi:hypothetical protein
VFDGAGDGDDWLIRDLLTNLNLQIT